MTSTDAPSGSLRLGRWVSWLLELTVLTALVLNSAGYVLLSDTHLENASDIADVTATRHQIRNGGLFELLRERPLHPPMHSLYMAAGPLAFDRARPLGIVLWGDVILLAGLCALAAALRRNAPSPLAGALCLILAGGTPLVNAFLKTVHYETTHAGFASLALAGLGLAGGLPGKRACVLLGLVMAGGLLTKWTFELYLIGPVLVATLLSWRRGVGRRELALRLAVLTATTALFAGLWYVPYLDLPRVGAIAAGNDPNFPGLPFWEAHRLRLFQFFGFYLDAAGPGGLAMLLLGAALACVRAPAGAALYLSCTVGPVLVIPLCQHQEARYLLPLMPGVCAAAALGLATLPRRALLWVLLATVAVSANQAVDRTWSGLSTVCAPPFLGTPNIFDGAFQLHWQSTRSARLVAARCRSLAGELPGRDRPLRMAIHPLEGRMDLKSTVFFHIQVTDREILGSNLTFNNYSPEACPRFASDVDQGNLDLIVLSEATLLVDSGTARKVADAAWSLIPAAGAWGQPLARPQLADPFMLQRLNESYGVAERVEDPCGPIMLLVNRKSWDDRGGRRPLSSVAARSDSAP